MLPTWNVQTQIDWSTWAKERGLLACKNEAIASFVSNAVADVTLGDKTFKAWRPGERVFPNLITVIIPSLRRLL